jgi:tetratricopeptide (TPR) repeat protein
MITIPSIPRIRRCRPVAAALLLLAVTAFCSSAFGHAGIHEEIDTITRLIRSDPANAQYFLQRGDLYRIHRDWDRALADFQTARQLGSTGFEAELGLGRTRLGQGLPQQALTHLDRALALRPGDVRTLVTRAEACRALDKPLDAAADYNRAIEQFTGPAKPLPEYYLERARAFAAAGVPYLGQALQGLDEGMRVLGEIRTLALYAVALERQRGNMDAAIERLDAILAHATRKEFLLFERGEILATTNREAEARRDWLAAQAAIATLPPSRRATPAVRQLLADIDSRLNAPAQADGDAR